ncbi:MAG: tetratricopeptide repeat protein [Muribaculaceae bacterium]|nr:tetratricopeptide repeat protein [Muribaculaceae bacterium]
MIVNGRDTLYLPTIGIYGRTSWYASRRNDRMPLGGKEGSIMRYDSKMAPIAYSQRVDYADWMNGAELVVRQADYGCAGCSKGAEMMTDLSMYKNVQYQPTFIYQAAVAEAVKSRELSGRAYVDFPVNKTEIYPNYRRNSTELAKIIATIDSVKNDEDITVTSISIKGFASPEGTYDNNVRLAKGRTTALKNYVQTLYRFRSDFIKTDYEPEDWEGLREYVVNSSLQYRDEILDIIDDPMLDPDHKDWRIKLRYPGDYNILLQNVYPGLRHSDYRIEYNIRTFSDPEEIRQMLRSQPQKLSLNEIYLAAQGLEPGSDAYNEVFETAVHMFPSEPVANLNAANAAMQRGDLVGAARYLDRAGDSPEATYARGVLAALNGDYTKGVALIEKAIALGIVDNQGILDHVREAAKFAN